MNISMLWGDTYCNTRPVIVFATDEHKKSWFEKVYTLAACPVSTRVQFKVQAIKDTTIHTAQCTHL